MPNVWLFLERLFPRLRYDAVTQWKYRPSKSTISTMQAGVIGNHWLFILFYAPSKFLNIDTVEWAAFFDNHVTQGILAMQRSHSGQNKLFVRLIAVQPVSKIFDIVQLMISTFRSTHKFACALAERVSSKDPEVQWAFRFMDSFDHEIDSGFAFFPVLWRLFTIY